MEIKDYYLVLKRNLWIIVSITLLFALVAYLLGVTSKPTYQASFALGIERVPAQSQTEVDYYQYDNYYSSVAAATLASNMSDWLQSAPAVSQVFEKAGYSLPTSDIKGLSKIFTVSKKQETSSILTASYSSPNKEEAERITATAASLVKEKVNDYSKVDNSSKFISHVDQPVVVEVPKQTTLNTLIALFLGFVISLGVVSIREALK